MTYRNNELSIVDTATSIQPQINNDSFTTITIDQLRTKWQFGDWESLAKVEFEALKKHPQRNKIALLVATAKLELGNFSEAKILIKAANEWGADEEIIKKILISSLHNSLGKICIASKYEDRAKSHFEDAIRLLMPNEDAKLLGHARAVRELTGLNLLPQAHSKIVEIKEKQKDRFNKVSHLKVIDFEIEILRDRIYKLKKESNKKATIVTVVGEIENEKSQPVNSQINNNVSRSNLYYGLDGLDKKLEAYINYDNGYFVELGANNGIDQSNTFYFEKQRGWKGLLIEPILHKFLECKKNRSINNYYACAACVSFSHKMQNVTLVYSNLMTTPIGVESDILNPRSHAESGSEYLSENESIVEVQATAKTLTSLLEEADSPNLIDLLSLDVEGSEIEVLKGIDFSKYKFKYILIESRSEKIISEFMVNKGYIKIDKLSSHDYLYAIKRT